MAKPPSDATARAIDRVVALLDARCTDSLDLRALSREAHLSPSHVIRLFRARFFETPHRYLVRRRIERARELLATTDMPVTDICLDVGFESLGTFSTLFSRLVGWSPSVYRARVLEQRAHPRRYIPGCFWTMYGFGDTTNPRDD